MGGYQYKYDVSLPIDRFYELVEHTRTHLAAAGISSDTALAFGYGHIGRLMCKLLKPYYYRVSSFYSDYNNLF
jgi:hypothetical protein